MKLVKYFPRENWVSRKMELPFRDQEHPDSPVPRIFRTIGADGKNVQPEPLPDFFRKRFESEERNQFRRAEHDVLAFPFKLSTESFSGCSIPRRTLISSCVLSGSELKTGLIPADKGPEKSDRYPHPQALHPDAQAAPEGQPWIQSVRCPSEF